MPAERAGSSPGGQGKAVPVEETAVQLSLPIATAESPRGATRRRTRDRLGAIRAGVPKAIVNAENVTSATMEEVANRLTSALLRVASKEGAPGPDGQRIEALVDQWPVVLPRLAADLLGGTYRPGEIRRAYIPKAGGGQRGLGIPDVVDRVVSEAVRQVLEPLWEPTFHPSSHGFRPGRSCHLAIAEAKRHLENGRYASEFVSEIRRFVTPSRCVCNDAVKGSDGREDMCGSTAGPAGHHSRTYGIPVDRKCPTLMHSVRPIRTRRASGWCTWPKRASRG